MKKLGSIFGNIIYFIFTFRRTHAYLLLAKSYYKILSEINDKDYIYWIDLLSAGVSQVHKDKYGAVYYYRCGEKTEIKYLDLYWLSSKREVWLTCSKEKYFSKTTKK